MIYLFSERYIHENAILQNRNELLADKTENSYEMLRNVTIKYFIRFYLRGVIFTIILFECEHSKLYNTDSLQ